ncbi:MAG: two pore domain potassium channel family protein, partial [Methanoregula sp.]
VYMQHLKKKYPYLFSLAMRTNPFDVHASAIVK